MDDWFNQLERLTSDPARQAGGVGTEQSRIVEQTTALLQALAAEQPLLLILDDLHWMDASSAALLFHLSRRIRESPILLIGTYRPEDVAVGHAKSEHPMESLASELKRMFGDIWIYLNRIQRVERRQFVDALLDCTPNRLSEFFRQALFRQTEGHALFTVELLHDMQTRGDLVQDQDGFWIERPDLDWTTLPVKVEGAIEKRVDRLDDMLREALLVASVVGEEFTAEVVGHILNVSVRELLQRFSNELSRQHRLIQEEGMQRIEGRRLTHFRFRHILFQSYLYNCTSEAERVYLHEEIGETLQTLYGDDTEGIDAVLAHHFQMAELHEQASHYLLQAGQRAIRLSSYDEAIAHLKKGLTVLDKLPNNHKSARLKLPLLLQLGQAFTHTQGYTSTDLERTLTHARHLCQEYNETTDLCRILPTLVSMLSKQGNCAKAYDEAKEFRTLAESVEAPDARLNAYTMLSTVLGQRGELEQARQYREECIARTAHYETESISFAGKNFRVGTLANLAVLIMNLGYPDTARTRIEHALAFARESRTHYGTTVALIMGAEIYMERVELSKAEEYIEQALHLCSEFGFPYWAARARAVKGQLYVEQRRSGEGLSLLQQALDEYQRMGVRAEVPNWMGSIAKAHIQREEFETGLRMIEDAFRLMDETGECCWETQLAMTKSHLLAAAGQPAEIESCLKRAIEAAQRQQARWCELLATMSLVGLWQQQDRATEAYQMLTHIYNWFTEGFDTVDLKHASRLMDQLKDSSG